MILETPILSPINAFDPVYEYTFEFSFASSLHPQVVSNRAIITDNDTQELIYDVKQDALALNHVLPANTLNPGHSYSIQIYVYDRDGNYSISNTSLFYCFTTPRFYFSNINDGDIVYSADLELKLTYEQDQTETLNEYKYYLYSMTKDLMYTSDSFYTENDMVHAIYGLKNSYIYYVRAMGKTVHGMNVDTGLIQITVKYINVPSNVAFEAVNDRDTGCIMLKIDIVAVDFVTENENYSIENSIVDLTGNTLTYMVGIDSDLYIMLKAKKLPLSAFCWSTNNSIVLSVKKNIDEYYIHLSVEENKPGYNIYKAIDKNYIAYADRNYITIKDDISMVVQIYRKNNIYDLEITYK
jgi:hypothetical protein